MRTVLIAAAVLAGLSGGTIPSGAQEETAAPAAIFADLRENSLSAEEIQGVQSPATMRVVGLDSLSGGELQTLEEILRDTEDGFAEVRAAIERNQAVEAALRERGVPVSSVVALTRSEAGELTAYTGEAVR